MSALWGSQEDWAATSCRLFGLKFWLSKVPFCLWSSKFKGSNQKKLLVAPSISPLILITTNQQLKMGVSENRGTSKASLLNGIFLNKPTIFGTLHFGKPPNGETPSKSHRPPALESAPGQCYALQNFRGSKDQRSVAEAPHHVCHILSYNNESICIWCV